MNPNAIQAVANAILYEGYMLYPYRPSAPKNRQGWSFGTLLPETYAAFTPGEVSSFQAELLVIGGDDVQFSAELRFLQIALKGFEAIERSVLLGGIPLSRLLAERVTVPFAFGDAATASPVQGSFELFALRIGDSLAKVTLRARNQTPALRCDSRDEALRQALVSAHALAFVAGGEFASLLDPPEQYRAAAEACRQTGVFPVLAGEPGERTAMLVSPIILYDYPQIAPASHGDFFDSSEIDEMLTLRVLTLTEAEKQELRAASDRARALLDRTEALTPEKILRLHGVTQRGDSAKK